MTAIIKQLTQLFIFIVFLLSSWPNNAGSQLVTIAPPKAQHIQNFGDIALGQINHIFEDSKGNIWLASSNGLIKHNGFTNKLFDHDPNDSNSVANNWLVNIIEDNKGLFWITTINGLLIKFNPETEIFTTINVSTMPPKSEKPPIFYNQKIDKDNYLWIATNDGPKRINLNTEQAEELPPAFKNISKKVNQRVEILPDGSMVFCYFFDGFFHYKDGILKQFTANPDAPDKINNFPTHRVRSIYIDKQKNIYFGTNLGMVQFNFDDQSYQLYPVVKEQKTDTEAMHDITNDAANDIMYMTEDINGNIWAGVTYGVAYFNPKLKRFFQASGVTGQQAQYPNIRHHAFTSDSQGNLWIGTTDGLVFIKASALKFSYFTNKDKNLTIHDIEPSNANQLEFIANFKHYKYNIDSQTLDPNLPTIDNVYQINKQANGEVWFGTLGDGIYRRQDPNQASEIVEKYTNQPGRSRGIYDFQFDSKGRLWSILVPSTNTEDNALFVQQRDTGKLQGFIPATPLVDLIKIDQRYMLTGALGPGLILIDTEQDKVRYYKETIDNTPNHIFNMLKSKDGTIWIGTGDKGLAKFDHQNETFTYYDTSSGFSNNSIYSLVEDQQQRLWLGTQSGLIRFDPKTLSVRNISEKDGLLFTTFRRRGASINHQGELLFGSAEGIVKFDPTVFDQPAPMPSIQLDDFKIFNQSVAVDSNILSKPINQTDKITLTHEDYLFSIHFSANEIIRPDRIQFAYRMKELDTKWIYTDGNNRQASFTTLSPGKYTFELKTTNRNGKWGQDIRQLSFTITPPFYQTKTAYSLYILLFAGSMVLFIKYRTEKFARQAKLLEAKVTERTEQLKQNRDELEEKSRTVSDLLKQKQKMFSSVSHEFRTPLTLILSPIEHLLTKPETSSFNKELTLIKRNGNRLLRMVDQLLEFAKIEQHQQRNYESNKLADTVKLICASFEPLFKSEQLDFSIKLQSDASCRVIVDSVNKIVINLISNAVKYTPKGGQIEVSVTQTEQHIILIVKDTGIGISLDDQTRVFERFNRATNHDGESIPGAGIGLALVKELIEANGGNITLQSKLGEGSSFIVQLPIEQNNEQQTSTVSQNSTSLSNNANQQIDLELSSLSHLNEANYQQQKQTSTAINIDDSKATVLIVDDNADLRALLQQQLGTQYQCLVAENGQVGVDLATEYLPDLVISDIMMPILDGHQLSQQLKNNPLTSHIPIILLSAKGSVESRIKGLENLVDDYLAKPFNIQELKLRINNILTIRELLKKRNANTIEQQLNSNNLSVPTPKDAQAANDTMSNSQLTQHDQTFCDRIYQQIEAHYQDGSLSIKSIANTLAISERQLQRKIKAVFDVGLPEMVSNYRLNKAIELLKTGHRVSNVYYEVGFSSHSYFSACFKAKYGITPKQYQQEAS